jgi:hypothetical protein
VFFVRYKLNVFIYVVGVQFSEVQINVHPLYRKNRGCVFAFDGTVLYIGIWLFTAIDFPPGDSGRWTIT